MIRLFKAMVVLLLSAICLGAQNPNLNYNKFKQLHEEWPTPSSTHNAAGAPGHEYWQQQADYKIKVRLDDEMQKITGSETITFHNNSPDHLEYLWLQLDQNVRAKDSDAHASSQSSLPGQRSSAKDIESLLPSFDGGFKLTSVRINDQELSYQIVKTMMRIDLPSPLAPGSSISFSIDYWYNINDRMQIGGRSGYEYFPKDDNYLYTIAQFYPRMCVYNDIDGWQNKQFLGSGEFTLLFGNYDVLITVPADHLVAATGTLANAAKILNKSQKKALEQAQTEFAQPVIVSSQEEAVARESQRATNEKTWHFTAENVRDFAFASSRKFIWDAMAVKLPDGKVTMAMSMYPKEGNPLWEKYSTKAVAHTLKWYSTYSVSYPYPVAWSINAARIGMEYPMICFNFGRCEPDGTYSRRTKYGMIGVIIHEVGHNFFPMIVNSDERQWTWMDEGLNTFLQYLTEQQWERNYPSRRGPAHKITDYMGGDKANLSPIMTNSESIWQFGNNAYAKPATALNILRETVLGRKLFDYAFKTYSQRWAFKHPTPYDFFRTMEDASGVDLDWFWRGWFYTTDHTDIAIKEVKLSNIHRETPTARSDKKSGLGQVGRPIGQIRNDSIVQTYADMDTTLIDFYSKTDPTKPSEFDDLAYQYYLQNLTPDDRALRDKDLNFYELTLENLGGLVMPVILQFQYTDGTYEIVRLPAEIWRKNDLTVKKVFAREKTIEKIALDPYLETADVDMTNNYYPQTAAPTKFDLFKERTRAVENEMQRAKRLKKKNKGT